MGRYIENILNFEVTREDLKNREETDFDEVYSLFAGTLKEMMELVFSLIPESIKFKPMKNYSNCVIKKANSLWEKIEKKFQHEERKSIKPFLEITDIVRMRFIFETTTEKQRVIEQIEQNKSFRCIESKDKTNKDIPGYTSHHFILKIKEKIFLNNDGEYENPDLKSVIDIWKRIPFEVQLRTILSHVWQEVEHANYKANKTLDSNSMWTDVATAIKIADEKIDKIIGQRTKDS